MTRRRKIPQEFQICKDASEPRIVGFICNWGAYSGLEMAGVKKMKYAPNVQITRLMCLGRVSTGLVLKAFELGADGVLLLGCPSGSCHYEFGIDRSKETVAQIKKMLNLLGLGSKRVHLVEVPPGEGDFVTRRINTFEKRIRELGPSPIKFNPTQTVLAEQAASLL